MPSAIDPSIPIHGRAFDTIREQLDQARIEISALMASAVGVATALKTTGADVNVSNADPPVAGDILVATDSTHLVYDSPLDVVPVMVGDSGAGGTKGLVGAPAIGDATKFWRGDATWAVAAGGGAATALATTGADVDVASASPGIVGQVLKLTDATHATWQDETGGGGTYEYGALTESIAAGAYLDIDYTDWFDDGAMTLVEVEATSATEKTTVEIFQKDSFAVGQLLKRWSSDYYTNPLIDTSAFGYSDNDGTQELHLRIANDGSVASTYTVLIRGLGGGFGGGGGGTPSNTVTTPAFGDPSDAGAAVTYSRGDHSHGLPALNSYFPAGW
jgi:predicted phage tail protein